MGRRSPIRRPISPDEFPGHCDEGIPQYITVQMPQYDFIKHVEPVVYTSTEQILTHKDIKIPVSVSYQQITHKPREYVDDCCDSHPSYYY